MEVLIFSHESDMDGLFSAAIGLLRYPQARTVFLGYGKESFETMGHFSNTFSTLFSQFGKTDNNLRFRFKRGSVPN